MSNWSSKISRVTMYLMTNRAGIFIKDVVFKSHLSMFIRVKLPLLVQMVNMERWAIIQYANRLRCSLWMIPQSAFTCTETYQISGHEHTPCPDRGNSVITNIFLSTHIIQQWRIYRMLLYNFSNINVYIWVDYVCIHMSHNMMQTSIPPSPPHRRHASQVAATFVTRICARRTDAEAGWGLDLVLDSWTFKVNDVTY